MKPLTRRCTTSIRRALRSSSTPCGEWRNWRAKCLERNGFTSKDLALVVPHQANLRIIRAMQERLGVDDSKIMVNIERYGNTTAGTIPLGLRDAVEQGRLKKGRSRAARRGWCGIYRGWCSASLGLLSAPVLIQHCSPEPLILHSPHLGGAGHVALQVLVHQDRNVARAGSHFRV